MLRFLLFSFEALCLPGRTRTSATCTMLQQVRVSKWRAAAIPWPF